MSAKFSVHANVNEVKVEKKQKVYKVTMGDKTVFTAAVNHVRAASNAFLHFGGAMEEVKPMTPAAITEAIAALPDELREGLLKTLTAAKKGGK